MIYNLNDKEQVQKAKDKLNALYSKGALVEIKEKGNKTPNQNSYLHLILTAFAMEVGENLEYIKQQVFKLHVNSDVFLVDRINPKTKVKRKDLLSITKVDKDVLAKCIDRFIFWSENEQGIILPKVEDKEALNQIRIEEQKNKVFL